MHIVLLCNPENRRATLFIEAVTALGLPCPQMVSYIDLLSGRIALNDVLTADSLLRIESPGENFDTTRRLITRGAAIPDNGRAERIPAAEAMSLQPDRGRIRFLRQWFLGYRDLLAHLSKDIAVTGCAVLNTPDAISTMFDKTICQQTLQHNGIPVPASYSAAVSYDELREQLKTMPYKRVFIKPAHASSASGVIAYRMQGDQEEAFTSMEFVRKVNGPPEFYNTLNPRRYTTRSDIRELVDFILREGAIVEEWIPKASMQGKVFDVRVVVINGVAQVALPRLSSGPITNLHLGNQRGNNDDLINVLGHEGYDRLLRCAEAAVDCIDGAFYAGVDVVIAARSGLPKVIELNAFGDLLPGLRTKTGEDIYTAIINGCLNAA